ncbi:MAG TPA: methyltransferase domain-containing protein [Gemmatimonadaceae bacterium]
MSIVTPARRRGFEYLDDPSVPPAVRERSQRDVARANTLLGGARALVGALLPVLPDPGTGCTLLDVGTGLADLPERAVRAAARRGVAVSTIGCDAAASLLHAARARLTYAVCADALALPFATASVDVVTCSQLLHHFARPDAVRLVREMRRVARRAVIVSDLRRSWVAMAGFWLVSVPLGFHPITRHDGALSVLRGFTARELAEIVAEGTGSAPRVARRAGFRLTALWEAAHA